MNAGRAGSTRWPAGLLVLGILAAACGCAQPGEEFVPVAGRVTVNGKPLTVGSVSFRPDPSRGNTSQHHPTGVIDAHGHFELYTLRHKGAPPGWYRVLVFSDANRQGGGQVHPVMPRWATHVKYTSEHSTDLFVEVVGTPAPDAYDLKLSP
jgi:hypothetical protein